LFGGLLAQAFGLRRSFVVAGIIILLAAVAVVVWVREGKAPEPGAEKSEKVKPITYRMAFRNRQLMSMLLLLVLFQLSINMFQPLMSLHIAKLQGGLQGAVLSAGFILSLIGIAGIVASPVWGRLGEQRGYYRILIFCGGHSREHAIFCQGFVVVRCCAVCIRIVYGRDRADYEYAGRTKHG
jgi:DHA1 family multidrug resistance protein-like MFS transporter